MMVLIGDTWQWTPFMFIVLLAAMRTAARPARGGPPGRRERFQVFRDITWPAIAPIAATVVLIG